MWSWLLIGIGLGVLLAVPAAWAYSKRVAQRTRRLHERLQTSQRLAELGTMTSGLAHEIKNPLSTVNLNVQLMQEDLADLTRRVTGDAEASEEVGRLKRRAEMLSRESVRLREILEDFLRFAGRVQLDRQTVNLNDVVSELADFFEPQAVEAGVKLRCQYDAAKPVLEADPALLKQALLNLMLNATQAMREAREKGRAHGGADELLLRIERDVRRVGKGNTEEQLLIHVIDTGPGIGDETVGRIFEPYFSQKRGGSGLGLPTTRRLIEEHGGRVTVHTEAGRGTDFVVSLPVSE